jgi:transposase
MSDSADAQILEYHNQSTARDMICIVLHVGLNRVSRVLSFFQEHHQLPPRVGKRRPMKVMRDILDFIDIRSTQLQQQSRKALSNKIHSPFDTVLSRATIANVRHELNFHYQSVRHVQPPKPQHIEY